MKTLHLSIIIGISFLSFVFLMIPQNSYAYTCAINAPSLTTQYYYLHSDSVFVGTVSSITNYTNHQWNVKFDVEKSWKGIQHPTITITTQSLIACGYSLVEGGKYLVFANGYPLDYFTWATKPFDKAQDEIALLDSPQSQAQANANEQLYKKMVNARDAISNMMGSKMLQIPISSVGINDLNFTLDVGIADKKASLPSGAQEYKQKLEEIVGNVPIRVQYEEYATALPEIITQHPMLSPLKQFKSGIAANDVKCQQGLQLVIKSEDGSPACVKPKTATNLIQSGWATVITNPSDNSVTKTPYNGIDKPSGIILLGNQTYYMTTFNNTLYSIPSSGTEISFHGVLFTLLRPLSSNANGDLDVVDVKFTSDNTNESLVIYPVGVGAVQADKVLSKHLHPQAGFIVYQYNAIKLLVSTGNQTSENTTLPASFMECDTPYPQSNTGVAVLYMPANSIGKICVRYSNPNDFAEPISQLRIADPNNNSQNATNITIWSDLANNTISKGNFTAVYWIKTGNQTGFYGLTVSSCIWTPFAVGYDNNSKIVASDFPFVGVTVSCPAGILSPEIDSMSGIGVKYIP